MGSNYPTVISYDLKYQDDKYQTTTQGFNPVDVVYDYLFNQDVSLKDRNKYLLRFLQDQITKGNLKVVKDVMSVPDGTLQDLHLSMLKGILFMTERIDDLSQIRSHLEEIHSTRLATKVV